MLSVSSDRNPTQKSKVKKEINVIGYLTGRNSGEIDKQMVTEAIKLKDACSLEEKLWPT